MDKARRQAFNRAFSQKKYSRFLETLNARFDTTIPFRVAETPVFLPRDFKDELIRAGKEVMHLVTAKEMEPVCRRAIPDAQFVPGSEGRPLFICLDFAVCDENGRLVPRLIELQGFPSLFAYQDILGSIYQQEYEIPDDWGWLFSGLSSAEYREILRREILGGHEPADVILLDIEPGRQNTYVDFLTTAELCQITIVGLEELILENRKLYYLDQGRKQQVKRIYNRVIADELLRRKDLSFAFHLTEDVDVEWAGHPNWFFKISKFLMPWLHSEYVPETRLLSDYEEFPEDLENYVLKPLFSFSGTGVEFHVTPEILDKIKDTENYILQKKVTYAPVVASPDGNVKTEIRLLYIWEQNNAMPSLLTNLCRLSRGEMIGVKYNQDKTWVGGSVAFFER